MAEMQDDAGNHGIKEDAESKLAKAIFSEIYAHGIWGKSENHGGGRYYSGAGSHMPTFAEPYIRQVAQYLGTFPKKPDVADLGCGDFAIGSQIRPYCGRYIAGDIVDDVIAYNRQRFTDLDVDFQVLNLAESPLPGADIVFVRQVFQHLSNAMIQKSLDNIRRSYPILVLTEHVPGGNAFVPNMDMAINADIRMVQGSGVVITAPPFSVPVKSQTVICDVDLGTSRVVTTVYEFA
ncbi:class I SAM-dependent methyltransferase [Alterisphingorhabdus coralli]|uniref:Class I SAM-dependent methyltransferase n=1 Tax=Alterisphingorhabdus coralli TaxID=3071408 RepID=A0AA97I1C9_9SPHN|nr:class I SAM-dependent methyltransferase [Parasphingorhabdus sp. SCSIO 66989]WOE75258.1 class I SAM-dependent methyltransferase [Parasphingorhabdus sp. SCSIO 66989]